MKYLNLVSGERVTVDDEDFLFLSKHRWYITSRGYAQADFSKEFRPSEVKKLKITMHRLVMKAKKGQYIDHINRSKLDNRKENLRFVTASQNSINIAKSRKTKSGFKGVFYYPWNCKSRPWQVGIGVNRKYKYIGSYATVEEAAEAYNNAALKYHGEYAFLNKIPLKAYVHVKDWSGVIGSNGTS